MSAMLAGSGLRPLSGAVQQLLAALEWIHLELAIPQSPEDAAALAEVATELRAQICTLVHLLKPLPITPDLGGGPGIGLGPIIGGRGRPSMDTPNPASHGHLKTGQSGAGKDRAYLARGLLVAQVGLLLGPVAAGAAGQDVGVVQQAVE